MTARLECVIRASQVQKHPAVAQGVRLHPFETEELGDALVVGTQQLTVDIRVDRCLSDLDEPVLGEEVHFEGEAENPADPEPTAVCKSFSRT